MTQVERRAHQQERARHRRELNQLAEELAETRLRARRQAGARYKLEKEVFGLKLLARQEGFVAGWRHAVAGRMLWELPETA